ncbi:hypothetical protein TEA_020938 [Camellia sinensis var. sinensis]|uniref:AB hydrolase-1 domain-containing protein n=1 Tax=Camellia sinensis var. sinensis TaxID=542762 RepID=A0A4S4ETG7_CAMSN|nr:hypothetical protein TEA_020938 [Camellia sinensis var. sinensis]
MVVLRWSAIQIAARTFSYFNPVCSDTRPDSPFSSSSSSVRTPPPRLGAFNAAAATTRTATDKPSICTADELHYVSVHNSDWRLALWRYKPPPKAPPRNHPLLLLSGVGTNAIGYDLSPDSSFARYMSSQGFDTWILELRGAGLSTEGVRSAEVKKPVNAISENINTGIEHEKNGAFFTERSLNINSNAFAETGVSPSTGEGTARVTKSEKSRTDGVRSAMVKKPVNAISENINPGIEHEKNGAFLTERSLNINSNAFAETGVCPSAGEGTARVTKSDKSRLVTKLTKSLMNLSERLYGWLDEGLLVAGKNSVIASQIRDLSQRLINIIEDGEQSLPSQFIDFEDRLFTTIEDFQKQLDLIVKYDWDFDHYLEEDVPAAADPAQALNVPVIPLGVLFTAAYPLASRPPYVLSWLNPLISVQNLHPELLEKFVLTNFCTVPAKLLLQLTTAFREGGMRDRSGSFFYKEHLRKSNVPVLALAGDQDLICPPEAVYDTVKLIPKNLVTYKVFGEPSGPHFAHYDLVGGHSAADQVYPFIIEFLSRHDKT